MLDAIREFFEQRVCEDAAGEKLSVDRLHLAAAALMVEVSRADHATDNRETDAVLEALRKQFGISGDDLDELVRLAGKEAREATDVFQFTSLVNDHFNPEQKSELVRAMWQVAYADGELHHYEEHLIRKVAELTYVPHSEFIRTKLLAGEEASARG